MAHQRQTVRYILYCIFFQLLTSSYVSANRRVNFHESLMSTDEVIGYIKSFLQKSSLDMKNEKELTLEDYAEDLYNKIDDLMSQESYVKLLKKTRDITDKAGQKEYLSSPKTPCNPSSVFKPALQKILKSWDKSNMLDELEKWQLKNENLPDSEQCNRFKGLTCQSGEASSQDSTSDNESALATSTCQCDGDPNEVGFFKSTEMKRARKQPEETYPEGCYVKPWKPCTQLFIQDSSRTILAQIIFPVGRTNKCKDGSNCLDLIPGMNKPICWCNADSLDKECKHTKDRNLTKVYIPPLDAELIANRRKFIKMVILSSDKRTLCNPEYNKDITKLVESAGMNPSKSGAVAIMEKLVRDGRTGKKIRICDFRKTFLCDSETRTCKEHLNCGTWFCAPNYICGEKSGEKLCLPDCTSSTFKGSKECSENLAKRAKGRNLMDGVEEFDNHGLDPAASHSEGFHDGLSPNLNLAGDELTSRNSNPCTNCTTTDPPMSPPPSTPSSSVPGSASPSPPPSDPGSASPSPPPSDPGSSILPDSGNVTQGTGGTGSSNESTTEPAKRVGNYGSTCQVKSDCDNQKFLDCYGGTCLCMPKMAFSLVTGSCHVLTNDACGNAWLQQSIENGLATDGLPAPECHDIDDCNRINDRTFCRPKNEDGPMLISKAKMDMLDAPKRGGSPAQDPCRGRAGSDAGILRSSNFLVAASCILYFAM